MNEDVRFKVVPLGNCFFVLDSVTGCIAHGPGGIGTTDRNAQQAEADKLNIATQEPERGLRRG